MKKFLLIVVIVLLMAAAVAFYLKTTTPKTSRGLRFPLNETQRELVASVPASATEFALIPTAAVVRAKLIANPITRKPLLDWAETAQLPRSWMIGNADLVVWRAGNQTSYAIHLDPLRAAVVRVYLMAGAGVDARVSSGMFLINAGAAEPLGLARADQLLALMNGVGPADALIVQQGGGKSDAFPPIARPSITAVQIGRDDITLTSRAAAMQGQAAAPLIQHKFAQNSLLTATFRQPPRAVNDLDRLFLARVSHLLDDGGSIVLYDVNAGTLLPRPDGLIVAKKTPENESVVNKIEDAVRAFGEIKATDKELLLSFDKDSMHRYEIENFVDATWPSNDWVVRIDPSRAAPILDRLGDNPGLRLAAPRIYRSARDLRRWTEYLSAAHSLEAAHSYLPQVEELRVRAASK